MFSLGDLCLDVEGCDVVEGGKVFCASAAGVVTVLSQDAELGLRHDQVPSIADIRCLGVRGWGCDDEGYGGPHVRPLGRISPRKRFKYRHKKQKDQRGIFMEMAFGFILKRCESVLDLDLPRCIKEHNPGCSSLRFGSSLTPLSSSHPPISSPMDQAGAVRKPYTGQKKAIVIALDVGTTFSGVSYALLDPGQIPKIYEVTR